MPPTVHLTSFGMLECARTGAVRIGCGPQDLVTIAALRVRMQLLMRRKDKGCSWSYLRLKSAEAQPVGR